MIKNMSPAFGAAVLLCLALSLCADLIIYDVCAVVQCGAVPVLSCCVILCARSTTDDSTTRRLDDRRH